MIKYATISLRRAKQSNKINLLLVSSKRYPFDGLGPFTIPNVRYKTGVQLTLYCRLYTGGLDSAGYSTDVGLTVPDEDGDVVAVTVGF